MNEDFEAKDKQGEFVHTIGDTRLVIYNSDCIAGMQAHLEKGSVDVVVTSPPYNLGIKYSRYDDTVPRGDYLDWIEDWAKKIRCVLSEKGSLFLNIGAKPSDPWVPFEVLLRMRKHFELQNVIHWVKSIAIEAEEVGRDTVLTRNTSIGHYKPINSPRFVNDCHEYIFHLTKNGDVELDRLAIGVEYQDKSNIARWKAAQGDLRCRGNTWFVTYRTIQSRDNQRPHPATFPVKIPKMCILLHGIDRTKFAMDPFLGIGHTALACAELGVDFVGFEIDPEYYSQACNALGGPVETVGAGEQDGREPQLPLFRR